MHTFIPYRRLKDIFLIQGEELDHLRVRRVKRGEKVGAIWEEELYLCELEGISKTEARLRIIERLETKRPSVKIRLVQAVPVELKTFETILQKSTELGVQEVVPLITERSFRNKEIIEKKRERWERIVLESMKQCKRPYRLSLREPISIEEFKPEDEINLVLDNFSEGRRIKDLDLKEAKSVSLVVGPEGGFSKRDVDMFKDLGLVFVKLEPHVLRTDTAAVVGIGLIVNLADP